MPEITPAAAIDLFGHAGDGQPVHRIRLRNARGTEAAIITLGASVQALSVPDRDGRHDDVVLGHDDITPYVEQPHYMGASVGRFANRIAGGVFELDGRRFELDRNEGANTLHGGGAGFDRKVWRIEAADARSVTVALTSPDGDQGFPGELEATATYRLADDADELTLTFEARTSAPTVVSLAPHAYFNLAGAHSDEDILGHELMIAAEAYIPVAADLIPTGELRPTAGGPFDFCAPRRIGERIEDADDQLRLGQGYDHNWVLRAGRGPEPVLAARLRHPGSGRALELLTTEPGLQFYSGNFLTGSLTGKGASRYQRRRGLCLEPQAFPDAPNRAEFPSARLDPGQTYRHHIVWRFSAD